MTGPAAVQQPDDHTADAADGRILNAASGQARHLDSEDASYITGQTINADGGMFMN